MMQKQGFNGTQGEDRTKQILGKHFIYVQKPSIDYDGIDFQVEIFPDNEIYAPSDRIQSKGRIQSKFFQGNNEVKISREYVDDKDGVRTDFFALLHTDEGEDEICFFFTAKDIKQYFNLKENKKSGKQFYSFRLTKKKKFKKFRSFSKNAINRIIEDGIRNTEEYHNQKYIQRIESLYRTPIKRLEENYNEELFKSIEDKHIIDKLYIALTVFSDFKRMTSWRIIDKISFKETIQVTNFYDQFSFHTTNTEILSFFENIEISDKVTLKNKSFFNGITDAKYKVNKIIEVLNQNLIIQLVDLRKNNKYKISKTYPSRCDCLDCQLDRFELHRIASSLQGGTNHSTDLWELMQYAYMFFKMGMFEKSKELLLDICEKAKIELQHVIYFFAKYNLRCIARIKWESEYPDLDVELSQLALSNEKKYILKIISSNSLFNDYSKGVDNIYLKIKDYKERTVVNDTASLINELKALLAEYFNFTEGNWIFINSYNQFSSLVEKGIESCIISYSMNTLHSYHLKYLDDFWVQLAVHYIEPNKLLNYFQRNGVQKIPYTTCSNYFENILSSFFNHENVDFLQSEINYLNNETENPDLRRKVDRVFENICILLAYLDFKFSIDGLLMQILYFIKKIDLRIHYLSSLAHPLIKKPEIFETNELVDLVEILITDDKFIDGYLLTNCLLVLKEKGFIFTNDNYEIIKELKRIALVKSEYGILMVLPYILPEDDKQELLQNIKESLHNSFNADLFYEAVLNNCLETTHDYITKYIAFHKDITEIAKESGSFHGRSPYTGINERARWFLSKFIRVVIVLGYDMFKENEFVKEIENLHPYYNFILNIDNYKPTEEFNINWLLENQSDIILKKIALNMDIKEMLKIELNRNYNKELSQIYIKFFFD